MKTINEMNIKELHEQLKNCYDVEKMITNNGSGWVHPDTAKYARLQYLSNRREIESIQKRLEELE